MCCSYGGGVRCLYNGWSCDDMMYGVSCCMGVVLYVVVYGVWFVVFVCGV